MQNLIDAIRNANTNMYAEPSFNQALVVGIRGQSAKFNSKVGDVLPPSLDTSSDDVEDYPQLAGTCACKIGMLDELLDLDDQELVEKIKDAISQADQYGDALFLVYGLNVTSDLNNNTYNYDGDHEIIIDDCTILAAI